MLEKSEICQPEKVKCMEMWCPTLKKKYWKTGKMVVQSGKFVSPKSGNYYFAREG